MHFIGTEPCDFPGSVQTEEGNIPTCPQVRFLSGRDAEQKPSCSLLSSAKQSLNT